MKADYVFCEPHLLKPGQWTVWPLEGDCYARCPNGLLANLGAHKRSVEQAPGGVLLTVSPSILCTDGSAGNRFHGYIERGVWLGEDRLPVSERAP